VAKPKPVIQPACKRQIKQKSFPGISFSANVACSRPELAVINHAPLATTIPATQFDEERICCLRPPAELPRLSLGSPRKSLKFLIKSAERGVGSSTRVRVNPSADLVSELLLEQSYNNKNSLLRAFNPSRASVSTQVWISTPSYSVTMDNGAIQPVKQLGPLQSLRHAACSPGKSVLRLEPVWQGTLRAATN
jgi:hypothetical protein